MLLGELKEKLKFLNLKIEDLENHIKNNELGNYNELLNELFILYDSRRSYEILIRRQCETSKMLVGKNEITLADANDLLKALKIKINMMSDIIRDLPQNLNIIQIIGERDKLVDEYILLKASIEFNIWSIEID